MVNGLTTANLGEPDYDLACVQHQNYIDVLKKCDVEVTILDNDNRFPDSVFIEDTALLTPNCAIIMNPGAPSRRGEINEVIPILKQFYSSVKCIESPGTVEGGDIMMVGSHYYIGLSSRTNQEGTKQVIRILENHGLSGSLIKMRDMLHLKTGLAYLENNNLLAVGEFLCNDNFNQFNIIEIPENELYAANSIWVNDRVIMPSGYPVTNKLIQNLGYQVIEVDTSEFRKLDGGVSCLSLRF
jgi:dimethylargininase